MAVEAATNCWTYAEDKLATALPQLAEFLVLTGAVDATAAAKFVSIDEEDLPHNAEAFTVAEAEERQVLVIVCSSSKGPYRKTRRLLSYFTAHGRLVFFIERLVPKEAHTAEETENANTQAIDRWLKNRVGKLLDELADYWLENGGPWIKEMGIADGPYHNDPADWPNQGHLQGIECFIEWGGPDE